MDRVADRMLREGKTNSSSCFGIHLLSNVRERVLDSHREMGHAGLLFSKRHRYDQTANLQWPKDLSILKNSL